MSTQAIAERVDRTALRTNQAFIVTLLTLGFLLNQPLLVVLVALVMLAGTVTPQLALFQRIYRDLLKPAGILKPDVVVESAAPHRFAQGMGGSVLALAVAGLLGGLTALGWALTILVIVLAAVNLLLGFCAGCFIYFQIDRLRGRAQ